VMGRTGEMAFDFDPREALDEIIASGCIPDRVAHQYFPTPEVIARAAIALADIGPDDTVLEPSAGQGGIADYFPVPHRAVCVEISKLHCDILRAKGFVTVQADFIEWARTAPLFDVVVCNPPFSEGRALLHLQASATLLKPAGRIVAVLPASFKGKDVLPGFDVSWSNVYEGEFAGTSVSTVILKAEVP
jgi:SAM-dependent methyltransferase